MVRAPCCEKMALKKGPWTPQEDQILISYIQQHGHGNWRALPKKAGLLRCGKSCRLRWTNYLRPDIKRGNFSQEEEETIINLHQMLGNRWSAIAAKLPGRTDNEIKNVWHTYLKKRLTNHQTSSNNKEQSVKVPTSNSNASIDTKSVKFNIPTHSGIQIHRYQPVSPQDSSSDLSSVTELTRLPNNVVIKDEQIDTSETFPQIDESFWSEELSTEKSNMKSDFLGVDDELQVLLSSSPATTPTSSFNIGDGMDFWYNLLIRAGGHVPQLPGF